MQRRVLVTGARGFIGRHTLAALAPRGFEVHAISSAKVTPAGDGVTWHRADLLNPTEARRVVETVRAEYLLHLAWHWPTASTSDTAPAHLAWVEASLGLLRLFAGAGGRRVVTTGTCAEYRWDSAVLSEHTTPLEPRTLYGQAKLAVGSVSQAFAKTVGIESVWARIFFVYGPHEQPGRLVPSVVTALLRGERARCTDGRQERDYLYVADVAEALVALLLSGIGGAVNIGSGVGLPVADLVLRLGELLGQSHRVELGSLPRPADDPPRLVADVTRLREELGWQPSTSLADGLATTVGWWRQQLSALKRSGESECPTS